MNAPALHSFVVGVTPEGKRDPLFVGTVGEARAFADGAEKAGESGGVYYAQLHLVEGARPTSVQHVVRRGASKFPPQTFADAAGAGASASPEKAATIERGDGGVLHEQPATTARREPDGTGELSQAAKPGLDDALAPAPEETPPTAEAYASGLAKLPRPVLLAEAAKLNLSPKTGISNADLRKLLVEAKFPPTKSASDVVGG